MVTVEFDFVLVLLVSGGNANTVFKNQGSGLITQIQVFFELRGQQFLLLFRAFLDFIKCYLICNLVSALVVEANAYAVSELLHAEAFLDLPA